MTGHLVVIQHDLKPMSTSRGCRAYCNTCGWHGTWVKFASTAQRHAEQHSPTYQGRHRTA